MSRSQSPKADDSARLTFSPPREDGASMLSDPDLLDRATMLNRVLVSFDDDLLVEGARRQKAGEPFSGVIYAHQLRITIGQCVHDLELITKVEEPENLTGQVVRIPL
jgi:hypothetical protein